MESLKDAVLGSKSSKANAEFEKALAQITAKQVSFIHDSFFFVSENSISLKIIKNRKS